MNDNNDPVTMEFQSQASRGSQSLQTLASGPLCSSISSLSSSSGTLPSNQDFHFYYNFDNFKHSIDEIVQTSHSLLQSVGSSATLWGSSETINFPEAIESIADDEALDWLVNVNDEILEQFNVSIDEFEKIRKKEEEMGRVGIDQDNSGFQLVCGNKKKKGDVLSESGSISDSVNGKEDASGVKVKKGALTAGTTKAKVPFHIPSIRKPQQEYNILVNNSNQYFEHVWLEISEDGQRFIHPLEKLSIMDFVDKDVEDIEPVNPPSIESTPFKLVEKVKDLKELAAKLRSVNEFAVDLEHNQYRSFQGLTCLMQISTRTEDFIIDTLKLRIHVGPYLREVFKDPTKKKVMHGAGSDVVWLQRDFGIYLCNLFDTGQASRILKLERNSLEHLLHHFCGVTAKKEYQNADWRLRPLPDEMLRYAREDTHYLLYIYDLMRIKLLSIPKEFEHSDAPLVEVYKRSAEICMQLYEKELLTESSYLHIYGLLGAGFNAKQLAIVSGLFEWRDIFARAEDESTGYVLPNKVLLEMAKQMPVTASQLRRVLKSKLPYVERNVDSLVSIIRHSMQNAAAFEADVQKLKQVRMLNASKEQGAVKEESLMIGSSTAGLVQDKKTSSFEHPLVNGASVSARETLAISGQSGEINACTFMPPSSKIATGATIQAVKKPTSGFGALLGNATSKKKSVIDKDKKESKLEQIRSSVNLSFHSFLGTREQSKTVLKEPTRVPEVPQPEEPPAVVASESTLQDIIVLEDDSEKDEDLIVLEDDSEKDESINDRPETTDSLAEGNSLAPSFKTNEENETMSPSELSTSFQQCVQSMNQNREVVKVNKSKEPRGLLQIKPFDYEAARKQVKYGEAEDSESGSKPSSAGKKKSSAVDRLQIEDGSKQFPQARRRQAFPASGNRSATFR